MKKVLITGVSGFVGSHLADFLAEKGIYEIFGTYLSERSLANVAQIKDKIKLFQVDLVDTKGTHDMIASIRPDYIYHLAALPAVGESYEKPITTITNNVSAQINVLEGVKNAGLTTCRILVVSSADIYGKVSEKDLPITEETPFMPTNTYAVSKIAQDYLGLQYFLAYNLAIVRTRPFNHIGPRQAVGFVVADFAKKIAEIEKGVETSVLRVGNLETRRDFTDVRDIVAAYVLLIDKGRLGEVYNIGRGESYKIEDILKKLVSLSRVKITIDIDKSLFRPTDAEDRVCNNKKFVDLTGWKPTISLEKTLEDTLDYWRQIV